MRRQWHVVGVVQGVGFRPFVYQLASRYALRGWVANTSAGVDMELEGDAEALDAFARALLAEKPPLARIDALETKIVAPNGAAPYAAFEIRASVAQDNAFQPIAPDMGVCDDCLRELFDSRDRRYRYPFINCTNCGPRFTIIQDIPYDRPSTTMRAFEMCAECAREYHDPANRRFHAQPVACPRCGPKIWLEENPKFGIWNSESEMQRFQGDDAILAAQRLWAQGKLVAVKGLGGFHLACDATNENAVNVLRARKRRAEKPFALMLRDLAAVERHCFVNDAERALLQARERPIVLLERRPESDVAFGVAPEQRTLGVMLPYTPLHYLLLTGAAAPRALVMTSGNLSDEPIAYTNDDARARLADLADAFLVHDRAIHMRTDDSVVRVFENDVYPLRRARGYAPFPVRLPIETPPLLAVGAELKNTFCVARERYAFLSHHIGDLENYETLQAFEQGVAHFEKLFRLEPQALAYDWHPNYLATRYARARAEREGIYAVGVQHHHAHIAACMAENGLDGARRVIGVAFDGTGYGDDGAIWGGEFLIADYAGYTRAAHLAYVPLPGGDKATREPWRMALAYLQRAGIAWDADLFPVRAADETARRLVRRQIERGINAPLTSSMGRLFDAAASLCGIRQRVNFEAQAAMAFEALANQAESGSGKAECGKRNVESGSGKAECGKRNVESGMWKAESGKFGGGSDGSKLEIDVSPLIGALVAEVRAGVGQALIAARFHQRIARLTRDVCRTLREKFDLNEVALSGGVWQNMTLLRETVRLLRADGFVVYTHRRVPANDGGIALGQALIAAHSIKNRKS